MHSPELLRDRNLFVFDDPAVEEISREFAQFEAAGWELDPLLVELVCLTAAEYSLSRWMPYRGNLLPLEHPIQVEHGDAVLGFLKTNCNPLFPDCFDRFELEGRPNLVNIAAFSSDVAKLNRIEPLEAAGLEDTIGDFTRAVEQLVAGHQESSSPRARSLAESGVLRLQGFLWAVKASLPSGELEGSVVAAQEAFGLTEPIREAQPVPG